MEKIYLEPRYDTRKSFYKKAYYYNDSINNRIDLFSYSTNVATIKDNMLYVFGTYSNTTLRHIKEFMYQFGFKVVSASEIMFKYGATRENLEYINEVL